MIAHGVAIWSNGNRGLDWLRAYPLSEVEDWPSAQAIRGHPSIRGDVKIGHGVPVDHGAAGPLVLS